MIKIEVIKTGEVKEVTNNIAHGLIESGIARLYHAERSKEYLPEDVKRESIPLSKRRGYKTK